MQKGTRPASTSGGASRLKESSSLEEVSWSPLKTSFHLRQFVRPLWLDNVPERPHSDSESSLDVSFKNRTVLCLGYPGLLLASLNLRTGALTANSIPPPPIAKDFKPDTRPSCIAYVGQAQLWIGTEQGTLHVIRDFNNPGFSKHELKKISDAVLSIVAGPIRDSKRSIYVGTASGRLLIFTGDLAPDGGLVNPFENQFVTDLVTGNKPYHGPIPIKCLTFADNTKLWCGVGSYIVVFDTEDLKVEHEFKAEPPKYLPSGRKVPSEQGEEDGVSRGRRIVSHLVPSSVGMWSACWHAPAVYLWDVNKYKMKTEIVSRAFRASPGWVEAHSEVSALAVDQAASILLIGTKGGHILLFDILPTSALEAFQPGFLLSQHHGVEKTQQIRNLMPLTQPIRRLGDPSTPDGPVMSNLMSFQYISCAESDTGSVVLLWEFRMPHDRDRLKRIMFYQHTNDSRTSAKPFVFPDLELIHVAPTALITKPL